MVRGGREWERVREGESWCGLLRGREKGDKVSEKKK